MNKINLDIIKETHFLSTEPGCLIMMAKKSG